MDTYEDLPQGRPEIIRHLTSSQFSAQLSESELVLGVDERTGDEFLVFGRAAFSQGQALGIHLPCLKQAIFCDTDELAYLLAAVSVVKGQHEYQPETGGRLRTGGGR